MAFNWSNRMSPADIGKATGAIGKMSGKLDDYIQKTAVSILAHMKEHGDAETGCKLANNLINSLGKGMRANSLRQYFLNWGPFVWNEDEKVLVKVSKEIMRPQNIVLVEAEKQHWNEAKKEPEFKPIEDWKATIARLVKKAKEDMEKLGENSKVNKDQVAIMAAWLE